MQRLRSTFNLLSDDNPQLVKDAQESRYNHLEHSSWSQILSSEIPSQESHIISGPKLNECPSKACSANENAFLSNKIDQQVDLELQCDIKERVHKNGNLQETALDVPITISEYVATPDEQRNNSNDRHEYNFQSGFEHLHNVPNDVLPNDHPGDSSRTCSECAIHPDGSRGINIHDLFNRQNEFEHRHNVMDTSVRRNSQPDEVSSDLAPANSECVFPSNRGNILDRFIHDAQNTFEHRHNIQRKGHLEEISSGGSEDYCGTTNASEYRNNVLNGIEHSSHTWSSGDQVPSNISSTDSEMSYAFGIPASPGTMLSDIIPTSYPVVNPFGHVSILLCHLVRVDISPSGSLCVHNFPGQSLVASNGDNKFCVYHPNGRVFDDGQSVHVATCQNRIARICPRSVTFSSSSRSLAYRVDESGTKTTAAKFLHLRDDLPMEIFRQGPFDLAKCGIDLGKCGIDLAKCGNMVRNSKYVHRQNGDEVWTMGGTQVKQDCYGNVEVSVGGGLQVVRVLPVIGEISVERSPLCVASVGCYSKKYMTVQVGNKKVTSGICGFMARNGSQKAGLDSNGKVVIF